MPDTPIASRWVKKHGNVRTRLAVVASINPARLQLRVLDPNGSSAYRKGQLIYMSLDTLTRYYEPAR